jgi:hypothetical protein
MNLPGIGGILTKGNSLNAPRTMPRLIHSLAVLVCGFSCGCAHYEYRILQPADAAQAIGKQPLTLRQDPLEYRFARQDDFVAMRIVNPTTDVVTLLQDKSYVVDPAGETHPLRGRTIAPHSYVGLTLPPLVRLYSAGYYSGFGMGYGYGYYDPFYFNGRPGYPFHYPLYGFYDPFFFAPPVYTYQETPYDWGWKSGEVRMKLAYERAGTNFTHDIVLDRRKLESR